MAGVTLIIVHPLVIVRPRCLLHFIHGMLSAMQQFFCDPQMCFVYRLRFSKCFFFISSAHALFEKRTEVAFYEQSIIYD